MSTLTDDERAALYSVATPKAFDDGQALLRQGENSNQVLLLHHGAAKVLADTRDGRVVLLGLRGRGDLLGEIRYLRGGPRTASVVATGRVLAQRVEFNALEALLRRYPRVMTEIARCVAGRLAWADRRRTEFGLPAGTRIRQLLHELALAVANERVDDQAAKPIDLVIPVTQRELGQLAGAAEVTVQKALREMARRGWLKRQYGRITIIGLAGFADTSATDPLNQFLDGVYDGPLCKIGDRPGVPRTMKYID